VRVGLHALRNALPTVINYMGPTAAAIMSGSLVIESLFHIPGAGSLFISAVGQRDDTLLLGTVLYLATLIVGFNLLVDVTLIVLNPGQRHVT
jgi:oligopeptide transport system permease protein